jgi:hypothetical protein
MYKPSSNKINKRGRRQGEVSEKKMKTKTLICLLLILMAGCMTTTQQVRDKATKSETFYMNKGYQQAYREVLAALRRNSPSMYPIQGDLYTDIQQGTISVSSETDIIFGNWGIYCVVDIKKVAESKTEITVYPALMGGYCVNVIKNLVEENKKGQENE